MLFSFEDLQAKNILRLKHLDDEPIRVPESVLRQDDQRFIRDAMRPYLLEKMSKEEAAHTFGLTLEQYTTKQREIIERLKNYHPVVPGTAKRI